MALTMGAFVFAVPAFANSVGSVEWQKTLGSSHCQRRGINLLLAGLQPTISPIRQ
jgi:hypothetical protein